MASPAITRPVRPVDIVPLSHASVFADFCSGEDEVDRRIPDCCSWHGEYRNRTFCAFVPGNPLAVGFYCIGVSAHSSEHLSDSIFSFWRRKPFIPFVYLNCIGVRQDYQNNGIGKILLLNAISKAAYTIRNIGIYGVALNALGTRSADFYHNMGFRETASSGRKKYPFMVLPAQSALDLIPG